MLGVISPAFALICQYLSSIVRDQAPYHAVFTQEENPSGFFICMRRTACKNNYLAWED